MRGWRGGKMSTFVLCFQVRIPGFGVDPDDIFWCKYPIVKWLCDGMVRSFKWGWEARGCTLREARFGDGRLMRKEEPLGHGGASAELGRG